MKKKQTRLATLFLIGVSVALGVLAWRAPPRRDEPVPEAERVIHQQAVKLLPRIRRHIIRAPDELGKKDWRDVHAQYRRTVRELEARWPRLATGEGCPDP